MKYKTILSLIMLLPCTSALANFNDQVTQYKNTEKTYIAQNKNVVAGLDKLSQNSIQSSLNLVNKIINKAKKTMPHGSGGKAAEGAMLFVSFSMPMRLIIAMNSEAAKYHIPLIIRGVVHASFRKTLQKILDVKSEAMKLHVAYQGVKIDPIWFRQFNISSVPALVVTKRPIGCKYQKLCPNQPYDVIYGNQSIHDSLLEIETRGSPVIRPIAHTVLQSA